MKRKKSLFLIMVLCGLLLLPVVIFAGGQQEPSATGSAQEEKTPVFKLRLAHVQNQGNPEGIGTDYFAELVEKYTDGTVTVEVFPASQLGNNAENFGAVQTGALEMAIVPYPLLVDIVPEYGVYVAGYFYENFDQQLKLMNHPDFGQAWNEQLKSKGGLRLLGTFFYGVRHLTTTDKPIYSPADLKGMKIRAVPNTMSLAVVRGMGGQPTSIAFAEIYEAMRQGVADGQENPLNTIYVSNFYQVQEYLMLTGHQSIPMPWVMNEDAFQELTPAQQDGVLRAASEAAAHTTELSIEMEKSMVKTLAEEGMTVITEADGLDIDAFRKSVRQEVLKTFEDEWPAGFAEEVLKVIEE